MLGNFQKKLRSSLKKVLVTVLTIMLSTPFLISQNLKASSEPPSFGALPSPNQVEYHRHQLAAFCHFGMNTFTNREWGDGHESPSSFTLTEKIDFDTYVKALKDTGFTKVIFTAKHHDGFCMWPSQVTDHNITQTNYPGDPLEELSAACTKYGLDMGCYLSPWDEHEEHYGVYGHTNQRLYNDFYCAQIEEIAGNPKYGRNGRFKEWWMDGAVSSSKPQTYDFPRIVATIQKHEGKAAGFEDDCVLFGAGAFTTTHWIGNEEGYAHEETWAKLPGGDWDPNWKEATYFNIRNNPTTGKRAAYGHKLGQKWSVPEVDARINQGWFWHEGQGPKSLETLANMYFNSIGHGAVLLLNIPLNKEGKLPADYTQRLKEFSSATSKSFGNNLLLNATANSNSEWSSNYSATNVTDNNRDTYWSAAEGQKSATLTLTPAEPITFDVVELQEYIEKGQKIDSFRVEYQNTETDQWTELGRGTTVGSQKMLRTTPKEAKALRVTVNTSLENSNHIENAKIIPMLSNIRAFKMTRGFSLPKELPDYIKMIDNTDFTYNSSAWGSNSKDHGMYNNTHMWSNRAGEIATFSFTGSKVYLYGTSDPGHGIITVQVDDQPAQEVDLYSTKRNEKIKVWESLDLNNGPHTVRITVTGRKNPVAKNTFADLDAAFYIDSQGSVFDIEKANYSITAGDSSYIKVKRTGNLSIPANVRIGDEPGSAVSGQYYKPVYEVIKFQPGEVEKYMKIETKISPAQVSDLQFGLFLEKPSTDSKLGITTFTTITLKQAQTDKVGTHDPIFKDEQPRDNWIINANSNQASEPASLMLDGNPETIWHTKWSGDGFAGPGEVVLTLPEAKEMSGLYYLPRQDDSVNGRWNHVKIYLNDETETTVDSALNWDTSLDLGKLYIPFKGNHTVSKIRIEIPKTSSDRPGKYFASGAEIGSYLLNIPKDKIIETTPEVTPEPEPEKPLLNGWHTIKGHKRYYRQGIPAKGIFTPENSQTIYLANSKGNIQYGWHVVNNKVFYFDKNKGGGLATGLVKVNQTYYLMTRKDGKLYGWHIIQGKELYFNMKNGGCMTGFVSTHTNGKYLLTMEKGKHYGWHIINGETKYFSMKNGINLTGLITTETGSQYLLNKKGKLKGWHHIHGQLMYFHEKSGIRIK